MPFAGGRSQGRLRELVSGTVRWLEVNDRLCSAAGESDTSDGELEKMVRAALADKYRSGVKPKFTAEQLTQIIAFGFQPLFLF